MLQSSSRGGVCLVPGGSAWSGGISLARGVLPAGGVCLPGLGGGGFYLPGGLPGLGGVLPARGVESG